MVFHRIGMVRMAGASAQPIPRVSASCATNQSSRPNATGGGPILADRSVAILVHSYGYGLRYAPGGST